MDEFWWSLMTIVGPIILLVLLIWLAFGGASRVLAILLILLIWVVLRARRRKGEPPQDVTERATRDAYAEEEKMRREGTDDR